MPRHFVDVAVVGGKMIWRVNGGWGREGYTCLMMTWLVCIPTGLYSMN